MAPSLHLHINNTSLRRLTKLRNINRGVNRLSNRMVIRACRRAMCHLRRRQGRRRAIHSRIIANMDKIIRVGRGVMRLHSISIEVVKVTGRDSKDSRGSRDSKGNRIRGQG